MFDWSKLKQTAFGLLMLKPDEFWTMTMAEFMDMISGFELRSEMELQRTAWLAANLINVHVKKKVTIDQLLGKNRSMSREDKLAQFEQLKQEIEKRKAE